MNTTATKAPGWSVNIRTSPWRNVVSSCPNVLTSIISMTRPMMPARRCSQERRPQELRPEERLQRQHRRPLRQPRQEHRGILLMNMLPQVIEVATEYEKRVTFWSSSSFLQLKTYSRRPLCVPNEPRHAIGTGNALLVYKLMIQLSQVGNYLL